VTDLNFELTEEQKDIRRAVQEFIQKEFDKEKILELDRREEFPFDLWRKACNLGFIATYFPEEYGGMGLGMLEHVIIVEELSRGDSSIGAALAAVSIGSEIILKFGSEEQKQKFLPEIPKGKAISAILVAEPKHGSDITFYDTKAVKTEKEYIVNGVKSPVTNAPVAKYLVTLCQTNDKITPPIKGQSTIIIESNMDGVTITPIKNKMGIRPSVTGKVSFNNCHVPEENLIGKEGEGFKHLLYSVNSFGRVTVAALATGIAQGAFDRALRYSKEREQFGQKIISFQVIQHKLADMAIKIETARLLTYKAAWYIDQGKTDPLLVCMAKCYASRVAVEVTNEAVQILGGYGYIAENEVEKFYRDSKVTEIYEGTTEILKNTIASFLTQGGLP
jgi:alkylation response protein AidB-like acyl-CoA dehydrogenase